MTPPHVERFLREVVAIFVIAILAIAGLLIWRPWKPFLPVPIASAVDSGFPDPVPMVADSSTPAPAADTLGVQELLALRELLREGRHAELSAALRLLLAQAALNIRYEQRLGPAWSAFELPELREFVDRWVAAEPDSALPRLILAGVLTDLAYARRGTRFYAETRGSQVDAMTATFDSALTELRLGLTRDPSALPGYWTRILIAMGAGSMEDVEAAGYSALAVAPASFLTRSRMMTAFLPRWGGSYVLMEELAEDAQEYAGVHPLIPSLLGFADMDRADVAMDAGDTTAALAYGEASLSHGPSYRPCVEHARNLLNSRRVADGLEVARCATHYLPTAPEGRVLLSYAWNSTGVAQWPKDWERLFALATDEARVARQLDPHDSEVISLWEFITERSRKLLGRDP